MISSSQLQLQPRPISVAIVDDHAVVREGLARVIGEQSDLELVGIVGTAPACRHLLAAIEPEVLLADINLGSESIFSVLQQLPPRQSKLRIVLLSAFPTRLHLEQAKALAVMGFVAKADDVEIVLAAIRSAAAGRRFLSPTLMNMTAANDKSTSYHPDKLSRRELEILGFIGQGFSRQALAKRFHISVRTVDRHRQNIMDKLNLHREAELVRFALTQ